MRRMLGSFLISALLLGAQSSTQGEVALRTAIELETVKGDLRGAIQRYAKLAEGKDRTVAAKALLRMAQCHEKLGNAEARKIYERIVRDFSDQKQVLEVARGKMGASSNAGSGLVNRKVWTLPAEGSIEGRISPDGRTIAYIDWSQGGNLFLHDVASGTKRQLTDTGTDRIKDGAEYQAAEDYAFSRDGKQLAYSWHQGATGRYELRVLNLQGSGVPPFRRLFDREDVDWVVPHDWSPDGKWIAVQLQLKNKMTYLILISAVDGALRTLKQVDYRGPTTMAFSPDGRYLGYDLPASEDSVQRDVFLMNLDGNREIRAVGHAANDLFLGWAPNGSRLLFTSDRSGSTDLWARGVSQGAVEGAPELLKRDMGHFDNMGVTPGGSLYYGVTWFRQNQDILTGEFDFDKGVFTSGPAPAVSTFVGSNHSPDWSNDGKHLAWLSRRGARNSRYFVIGVRAAAGGPVREVVPYPNFELPWSLCWGHDSNSFLITGRDIKGREGIFRVDASTGNSSLLFANKARDVMESAEGKEMFYLIRDGSQVVEIVKRTVATGAETVLLKGRYGLFPSISPDGRFLAVMERQRNQPQTFWLVPTNGDKPRALFAGMEPRGTAFGAWTPDGKAVLVNRLAEQKVVQQWRVPLDGGKPELRAEKLPLTGLLTHPDGRRVVTQVALPQKPVEVWVLENFLPN